MEWDQRIAKLNLDWNKIRRDLSELKKAESVVQNYFDRKNNASKSDPGVGGESKGGESKTSVPIPEEKYVDPDKMPFSWLSNERRGKNRWLDLDRTDKKLARQVYKRRIAIEKNPADMQKLKDAKTLWNTIDEKNQGFVTRGSILRALRKKGVANWFTDGADETIRSQFLEKVRNSLAAGGQGFLESSPEMRQFIYDKIRSIDQKPQDDYVSYDEFIVMYYDGNFLNMNV